MKETARGLVLKIHNRLIAGFIIAFSFILIVFWKIDYVYEVALFNHLAQTTPSRDRNLSALEVEESLFNLTTHQISRMLHTKDEKSPLVFLLTGFALCDQQAKVLTRFLYFRNIKARAVPLFFDSGISNHTIFEWLNEGQWVISDPFLHFPINIPASDFLDLDTHLSKSEEQKNLIQRAHAYYQEMGLLKELKETYDRPNHSTWEYFRKKPETQLIESAISAPLRLWPRPYLKLLNDSYRLRFSHQNPLLNQYLKARHQELMGECRQALNGYESLLERVEEEKSETDHQFNLSQSMIKWRIDANLMNCEADLASNAAQH
mgnify:CR=1 FL=1